MRQSKSLSSLVLSSRLRESGIGAVAAGASRYSMSFTSNPASKNLSASDNSRTTRRRRRRHERRLPRGVPPTKTAVAIVAALVVALWSSSIWFLMNYGHEQKVVDISLNVIGPWVPAIGGVDLRKSLPKSVSDLRGGGSSMAQYKPNLVKSPKVEPLDVTHLTLFELSERFNKSLSSTSDFVEALTLFALYRYEHQVPDGYRAYSVGMSLGMKDVLQNVAKVRAFLLFLKESDLRSSTLTFTR